MEIKAELKFARISPRKARLVAANLHKMRLDEALTQLEFSEKKAAGLIKSVLNSAIANAKNNFGINKEDLVIKQVDVLPGPFYKRWRAVSRGAAHLYKKRTSHIKVILTKIKSLPENKTDKEKKDGTKS